MLVFNPDGTFKAMIEYNQSGQAYLIKHAENLTVNPKFDIHNDQIYYLDSGFRTIHVVDLNGNCIGGLNN